MIESALAYVQAGYRVIPLYTNVLDEETGELYCSCGNRACASPGKHPLTEFAPRGSLDATSDPNVIATWPDGINIGVVMSDTDVAIDIDDPEIVEALLEPEFALGQIATVVTTGRGLHIWLRCAPTRNGILKRVGAGPIGEMRANNLFVAAPPSVHYTGRRYRWLTSSVLEQGPTLHPGDGWSYIIALLKSADIELAEPKAKADRTEVPTFEEAPEFPFPIPHDATDLRKLADPMARVGDRSAALFRLACEAQRVATANSIDLDPSALAAYIKHVDRHRPHAKGSKYSWRNDADRYYWELVTDARESVQSTPDSISTANDGSASSTAVSAPPTYSYTPADGMVDRSSTTPKRIANFEAIISEERRTWGGEEDGEIREEWILTCTRHAASGEQEEQVAIRLAPEQRGGRKFEEAVSAGLPPRFIIENRMSGVFATAVRYMSLGRTVQRSIYAASGWLPDRDAFLLPGARGAITPDGIDETLVLDDPDMLARYRQYGRGVEAREDVDLANSLRMLYSVTKPEIMLPLMAQMFAAPLASLGAARNPGFMHLHARSGSFKTTLARLAMSIYGDFIDVERASVERWTATANMLQLAMYTVRDLPLLIDDYKLSGLSRTDATAMVGLIQSYADRTTRGRMNRNQKAQKELKPRCLVLSTGEDVWEGQESVSARSIIIDASLPRDANDDYRAALLSRLTTAQAAHRRGEIQYIGYEWIHWLTQQGKGSLRERIDLEQDNLTSSLQATTLGKQHARVAATLAGLGAVDKILRQFIADRAPSFLDEYLTYTRTWSTLLELLTTQAEGAKQESPYEALRTAIEEGLATGEGCLRARLADGTGYGQQHAPVLGFVDHEFVWLSKGITLGWYQQRMRSRGVESHVGWQSFLQEAEREHGAVRPDNATHIHGQDNLRLLAIPVGEFLNVPDSADIREMLD